MGLFSRTPNTIQPIPTHLDMAWFRAWMNGVIHSTGVDPTNDANGIALLTMGGMSTHVVGNDLMDRYGGAWAKPILAEYMGTDGATPWGAVEVIAGWRQDAVPILEQNLASLAETLVEVGPAEDGEFKAPG
jgi:hypothetical protein